nr:transposase [Pseudoalteromonas sp. SANK 73390]
MKKSKFSDSQIMAILKQADEGIPVPDIYREHNIGNSTFYKWRSKYGGMDTSLMAQMKELEEENRRLKKMYVDEKLKAEIVQEAMQKSGKVIETQRDGAILRCLYGRNYKASLPSFLMRIKK